MFSLGFMWVRILAFLVDDGLHEIVDDLYEYDYFMRWPASKNDTTMKSLCDTLNWIA